MLSLPNADNRIWRLALLPVPQWHTAYHRTFCLSPCCSGYAYLSSVSAHGIGYCSIGTGELSECWHAYIVTRRTIVSSIKPRLHLRTSMPEIVFCLLVPMIVSSNIRHLYWITCHLFSSKDTIGPYHHITLLFRTTVRTYSFFGNGFEEGYTSRLLSFADRMT